jgi:hypothetical protein
MNPKRTRLDPFELQRVVCMSLFWRVEVQECREHANRCLRLAQETNDPAIKASLLRSAEGWKRLAQRAIERRKHVSCRCAHREAVQHYLSCSVASGTNPEVFKRQLGTTPFRTGCFVSWLHEAHERSAQRNGHVRTHVRTEPRNVVSELPGPVANSEIDFA